MRIPAFTLAILALMFLQPLAAANELVFERVKLGMTLEEVKEIEQRAGSVLTSETEGSKGGRVLNYTGEVFKAKADIRYDFRLPDNSPDGRPVLAVIMGTFSQPPLNRQDWKEAYAALSDHITEHYGQPIPPQPPLPGPHTPPHPEYRGASQAWLKPGSRVDIQVAYGRGIMLLIQSF